MISQFSCVLHLYDISFQSNTCMLVCYTGFVFLGDSYVMNSSFNPCLNMYNTMRSTIGVAHHP
ncbi:hypothetical protein HanRHA438_Chr09g0399831 [Helianthus annuus]|nr:hypothetical protein HanIR_Chr09g0418681 [Helianthus annuus]KAJ0888243.1 hypothetical protein HanRHA438_Chr09g0399831 [Helianthus annuus]